MTATVFTPVPFSAPAGRIIIETVLLSARDGELHYRVRTGQLPDGGHPDELARALTGFDLDRVDAARLLHSTSWRFDGGAVVLTYAALPDPSPAHAAPLKADQTLPYAVDPLAPALERLTVHDVAVHACRHLAYLRQTDPVVSLTADEDPELWRLIGGLSPTMAGLVMQPDLGQRGIAS